MEFSDKQILAEIKKFQTAQKRMHPSNESHGKIGEILRQLFAEMARRQKGIK